MMKRFGAQEIDMGPSAKDKAAALMATSLSSINKQGEL